MFLNIIMTHGNQEIRCYIHSNKETKINVVFLVVRNSLSMCCRKNLIQLKIMAVERNSHVNINEECGKVVLHLGYRVIHSPFPWCKSLALVQALTCKSCFTESVVLSLGAK